MATYLYDYLKT